MSGIYKKMGITLREVHAILVSDIMGTNIKQGKIIQGKMYKVCAMKTLETMKWYYTEP